MKNTANSQFLFFQKWKPGICCIIIDGYMQLSVILWVRQSKKPCGVRMNGPDARGSHCLYTWPHVQKYESLGQQVSAHPKWFAKLSAFSLPAQLWGWRKIAQVLSPGNHNPVSIEREGDCTSWESFQIFILSREACVLENF